MSEQKLKTRRRAPRRTRADRRPTLRRRLFICLLALICLGAGAAGLLSRGTSAQIPVNEPPVAPHDIIVFPSRDFISVSGYVSGEALTASVFHPLSTNADGTFNYDFGSPVSTAHGTADATGTFEVNHPGGFCWETVTPDIRPGDVVRITRADGSADQTTVSNVTAERAVLVQGESAPGAKDGVVQIHGTAQDSLGRPLPLDQIEQRLVVHKDHFDFNGRRTLRAPGGGGKDGTLAYDAAGSINWTATYAGLDAADVTRALGAESRVLWLGRDPLAGTESTIFEIGDAIAPGPQAPCAAPLEGTQNVPPPQRGPVPPAPAYTALNDPPVAPHQIIAFPERDFVSIGGYPTANADGSAAQMDVNVLRHGITVGAAQKVTANVDGLFEVNHPGGACWEGQTPDIRPGDVVRVTVYDPTAIDPATGLPGAYTVADQTTVANVRAERPVQTDAFTVQIHGTAQTVDGFGNVVPLPADQIEQRLIGSSKDPFDKNGRRALRADAAGTLDGTLAYDPVDPATNPQGVNWTATYTNLTAADVQRAVASESRILWLGRNPLAGVESTIFEIGDAVIPGPQAPCTAPLEPTLLVKATPASGVYAVGPNVVLTATDGTANVDTATIYYTTNGTTPTTASARYTAPIPMPAGTTVLKFMAADPTTTGLVSVVFVENYTVDTAAPPMPPTPDLIATDDSGLSNADNVTNVTAPTFVGSAESGSTVTLVVDGADKVSGGAAGGAYTLTVPALAPLADGAHTVRARACDAAGNCTTSDALTVTIDTAAPTAPAPDMDAGSDSGVSNTDDLTNVTTPTFSGSAEKGAKIDLFVDGVASGSALVNDLGVFQVTASPALADGLHSASLKQTDVAGNVSALSGQLNFTVDTLAPTRVTANPVGGLYGSTVPQSVVLNTESGARIFYTTDGSRPDTTSTQYVSGRPITLPYVAGASTTTTIKFFAVDDAGNQVAVSTEIYTMAPPAAPTGLTAAVSRGQVILQWKDGSTNEAPFGATAFVVERATSSTGPFTVVKSITSTEASPTTTGKLYSTADIPARGTYFYRVRAVNGVGNSAPSNTVTAKV